MNPRMRIDPLLFHMPLDTKLEILTARDTGFALIKALECEELSGKTYNLGGGCECRTTYKKFLDKLFSIMGLGNDFLPRFAFAEHNFHCGYYLDSDKLENLLRFRRETLEDLYKQIESGTSPIKKFNARLFKPMIKAHLLRHSEPLKAQKTGNRVLISRFFPAHA